MIGQSDVIRPDIVLPFPQSNHSAQDVSRVNANTHVYIDSRALTHRTNGVNHKKSHSNAINRVIGSGHGKSRHAIVAVAQNLDSHAVVLLRQLVEAAEEVIQSAHQF